MRSALPMYLDVNASPSDANAQSPLALRYSSRRYGNGYAEREGHCPTKRRSLRHRSIVCEQ